MKVIEKEYLEALKTVKLYRQKESEETEEISFPSRDKSRIFIGRFISELEKQKGKPGIMRLINCLHSAMERKLPFRIPRRTSHYELMKSHEKLITLAEFEKEFISTDDKGNRRFAKRGLGKETLKLYEKLTAKINS